MLAYREMKWQTQQLKKALLLLPQHEWLPLTTDLIVEIKNQLQKQNQQLGPQIKESDSTGAKSWWEQVVTDNQALTRKGYKYNSIARCTAKAGFVRLSNFKNIVQPEPRSYA